MCSFTLGKPLFVLKQLFAFSFASSFPVRPPARPPPAGGGGCCDGMRYRWGWRRTAWWVHVAGCVAGTDLGWVGPGGPGDHARVFPSLRPPPPPGPWTGPVGSGSLCPSAHPPPPREGVGMCPLVWCYPPFIRGEIPASIAFGPW